ncbi:hypothetical protein CVT24_008901 [Panaeolus cyanescens]|uniref:ABM domain-containing protein n=1 Tax=Panaeolus cyanescens TaxID=181874 RepID=A0A409VAZ7_9AGAR|nr:hypothetical protein CVT24_008901 [Panaeolus cyanescens]
MSNPIVEFVSWAATPAYVADPTLLQPVIDIIKNSDGNLGIFTGLVEEDNSTLYMAIVWQSFEHHQKLMDDKITYGKLFEALAPVSLHAGSDIQMHHVEFGGANVVPAFTSGTTEYTIVTLKEGKTNADLLPVINNLIEMFKEDDSATYPGVAGPVKEDPRTYVLALGWKNSQLHMAAAVNPAYQPTFAAFREVVDFKRMVHIKLVQAH